MFLNRRISRSSYFTSRQIEKTRKNVRVKLFSLGKETKKCYNKAAGQKEWL